MKGVIVKRFQPFVKNPNQVSARNLLFCHKSEFTVAAPVVDGDATPSRFPKRKPRLGMRGFAFRAGRSVPAHRRPRRPNETIFPDREVVPQQIWPTVVLDQTAGFDHAGPHPQHDLPPISQGRPSRHGKPGSKPMTEVVTALFVFFSISVFLAHAFDAYYMR